MRYCGVVPMRGALQLALLEEVRAPEPPIQLSALFYEPGSAVQVAAELRSLEDVVVGVGAPLAGVSDGHPARVCDELLSQQGVMPQAADSEVAALGGLLRGLQRFSPAASGHHEGPVGDGDYRDFPLFETNADAVFCALQGRQLPAKRHPYGLWLRIEELAGDRVEDEGGDLWHRRIEEIDAVVCALCAYRYAVGHASWLGEPEEGVVVLPGASLPAEFPREGVIPPVERLQLPQA